MSDPLDEWEWFAATVPSSGYSGWLYAAASDGEQWVGVGDLYISATHEICVAVGDAGGDTWDLLTPFTTPTDGYVTNIAYGDGTWVGVGGISTGAGETLVATTDNPSGTWQLDTYAWGDVGAEVVFGGGTWALVTQLGKVYTATDPAGTWTLAHDFSANARTGRLARITYYDGTWAVAYQQSVSPYAVYVYSATDPSGTWTARGSIGGGYEGPCGIGKTPGGWFVRLETALATKDALADAAWTVTTGLPSYSLVAPGPGFGHGDGIYVAMSNSASNLDVKTASSITGPFTAIDADSTIGGQGTYLYGGPYFNGEDWVIVGGRGYTDEPGVLAPASVGGTGWGVLL